MHQPAPAPLGPHLDSPGIIVGDIPCAACSYNLRGLSRSGRCPECGEPVHDGASRADFLENLPRATRDRIDRGLSRVMFAYSVRAVAFVLCFADFCFTDGRGFAPLVSFSLLLVLFATFIHAALGWRIATTPDPALSFKPDELLQLQRLRTNLWIFLASAGVCVAATGCLLLPIFRPGGAPENFAMLMSITGGAFASASIVAHYFLSILTLRALLARSALEASYELAGQMLWLMPMLTGLLGCMFGIGFVIGIGLYWSVVRDVRRAVQARFAS